MKSNPLFKAAILTLVFVVSFTLCYEFYWRSRGFSTTYNDDKILWTTARKEVYNDDNKATVFIGSSRVKFDLDIPTWEKLTGEKAIQLAFVATSPRPVLRHLAEDESFKGKLIIDMMEPAFFSPRTFLTEKSAIESITYFQNETPAQKASAILNYKLESNFVVLEEGKFGLNNLLTNLQIPCRPGVFSFPDFPQEFAVSNFNRQTYMTPMFLADPVLIKKQTENWTKLGALDKTPGIKGEALEAVFNEVKAAVDKIRARGGSVVFIRPPSNGGYLETENFVYPRKEYWDAMLAYIDVQGIHYRDYAETANFVCPEWSHLTPEDAIMYTTHLVKILQEEKGWSFPKQANLTSNFKESGVSQ
jgi:hypothetical protein